MVEIYIDGSGFSGDNSAYCILFPNYKKLKVIYENRLGIYMETIALRDCLRECKNYSIIYTDCKILIGYIKMNWLTHLNELIPMIEEIKRLLNEKKCKLFWINRFRNPAGIYLENRLLKLRRYKYEASHEFNKKKKLW